MDSRIKNIVESFDFSKLNNNHPGNTKAVDQIRKDYFMEDEIGWEILDNIISEYENTFLNDKKAGKFKKDTILLNNKFYRCYVYDNDGLGKCQDAVSTNVIVYQIQALHSSYVTHTDNKQKRGMHCVDKNTMEPLPNVQLTHNIEGNIMYTNFLSDDKKLLVIIEYPTNTSYMKIYYILYDESNVKQFKEKYEGYFKEFDKFLNRISVPEDYINKFKKKIVYDAMCKYTYEYKLSIGDLDPAVEVINNIMKDLCNQKLYDEYDEWEIWEGETIEQKIKKKNIILLKPYYSFRVSSPDIYGDSAIITHEIYKEGNEYLVRDTIEQN